MQLNSNGLAILRQEEGLADGNPATPELEPYLCPANVWTWGYGHAITHPNTGKQFRGRAERDKAMSAWLASDWRTREDAERLLADDAAKTDRRVRMFLKAALTSNQFSAFVCLAFNIGAGALADSSAWELAHAGRAGKLSQVPDAIRKWNKYRKYPSGPLLVSRGLTIRREIEARLFATPDDAPFNPLAIRREMEAKL